MSFMLSSKPIYNKYGQPISFDIAKDWKGAIFPTRDLPPLKGKYCTLVPLDAKVHGTDLFQCFVTKDTSANEQLWTYMPNGPFHTAEELNDFLTHCSETQDPLYYAVINNETKKAVGIASYLRINPKHGLIEVGWLAFSPTMQRTPLATETQYLLMHQAFEVLKYRRYEWKCDVLNIKSINAAKRLGFLFDGIFRQCIIYKGRNRDTAWFSILDSEWPLVKIAFEQWLHDDNFNINGIQKQRLQVFMKPLYIQREQAATLND